MDLNSHRSSTNSINTSYENIILYPSEFRNSAEIRTSQSLSAVINGPEGSLLHTIWEKANRFYMQAINPSPFLREVHLSDFFGYIAKIEPLLQESSVEEKKKLVPATPAECFEQIPNEFFSEDFTLDKAIRQYNDGEELSDHLDMIDLTIFYKISQKWQRFLGASYDLEAVQKELKMLVDSVRDLKAKGSEIEANFASKLCRLVRLQRRLKNIKLVHERLLLVRAVKEAGPTVKNLLTTEHYAKATQLIIKTQQTLSSKLKGVHSVRNERAQLEEIKKLVVKMIDEELNNFVVDLLVSSVFRKTDKLVKLLTNGQDISTVFPENFDRARAEDLVENKLNTGTLNTSLLALKTHLIATIKEQFKQMANSLGVFKTDENSKWANISHSHMIIVLQTFKTVCFGCFHRLKQFGEVILRKLGAESQPYWEAKSELKRTDTSKPLVSQLEDFDLSVFSLFSKKLNNILKMRRRGFLMMEMSEIGEIYKEIKDYAQFYTDFFHTSGELSVVGLLLDIEQEYFASFHEKKKKELEAFLEGETWNKVSVPEEMTRFIMEKRSEAARMGGIKLKTPDFSSTSCLLMFYKQIYEYVKVCESLNLSGQGSLFLIDFMKYFNKSLHTLILEAGATSLRLKTITSKHLGLSAQSVSFILEEIPYVQVRVSKAAGNSEVILAQIEQLSKEYKEHLNELYSKLVGIITERAGKKCDMAVVEAKWDVMMPPSQLDKEYYCIQMANDISSMLSILQTVLSIAQIQVVFSDIVKGISKILIDLYAKVNINHYIPAQRVKNDVQQLLYMLREKVNSNLQEYVEDLEEELNSVVSVRCQPYLDLS